MKPPKPKDNKFMYQMMILFDALETNNVIPLSQYPTLDLDEYTSALASLIYGGDSK